MPQIARFSLSQWGAAATPCSHSTRQCVHHTARGSVCITRITRITSTRQCVDHQDHQDHQHKAVCGSPESPGSPAQDSVWITKVTRTSLSSARSRTRSACAAGSRQLCPMRNDNEMGIDLQSAHPCLQHQPLALPAAVKCFLNP